MVPSHGAAAAYLHPGGEDVVGAVCTGYKSAPISDKLKALLAIAEQVQIDGKRVTTYLIDHARGKGATDIEIHDTVLIAAAFCMFNRYVDGLDTVQPTDPSLYTEMGKRMALQGYSGGK